MFSKPSIYDYYRTRTDEISNEVRSQPDSYILSVNVDEYVSYLIDKYGLPEIVFDDSRTPTIEKFRQTHPVSDFGETFYREFLYVRVSLPVVPNDKIRQALDLLPSTFSLSPPKMSYTYGTIVTEVQASAASVERAVEDIKTEVERRNTDIRQHNLSLKTVVTDMVNRRRAHVQNEEELLESIAKKVSIPLRQKAETSSVVPTAVRYSDRVKAVVPPKANPPTELTLEREKFNAILNLIDNSCRLFERTPLTFAKLEEEELRDVILSNLNGVFEGDAVGEAFSKRGKTDIYLKVSKGGVFIAECKYWSGPKTVVDTVEQILGYLTWRHSYGVVVLFSKRKNFTDVITSIANKIHELPSYVKGLEKIDASHFKAIHSLPEDDKKLIEMHYVVYSLYCKTE